MPKSTPNFRELDQEKQVACEQFYAALLQAARALHDAGFDVTLSYTFALPAGATRNNQPWRYGATSR